MFVVSSLSDFGQCEAHDLLSTPDGEDAIDVRCQADGVPITEQVGEHTRTRIVCAFHRGGYLPC